MISSISPATGSTLGGTAISISGKGFGSDATVGIGGAPATGVSVQGTGTISAITPATTFAGAADVVVTSGGHTATMARGFTFVPPTGANQAPIISNIISIGSRPNQPNGLVDLDETVTLVASVSDVETVPGALSYAWSGPGAFSGSGAIVTWRAPATFPNVPPQVPLTLTVTETYTEGSVTHKNTASRVFAAQLHDSQKEILDMGEDFLTLFSQSNVPASQVLHNFSATCDRGFGRSAEQGDVEKNRRDFIQDFSRFRITRLLPVTFNFGGACPSPNGPRRADACSRFTVHWEVIARTGPDAGKRGTADGTDFVTAVWENNRWFLCHSDFQGTATDSLTGIRRPLIW